jgi:EmrB/QacA subfamily drug resistance transporter
MTDDVVVSEPEVRDGRPAAGVAHRWAILSLVLAAQFMVALDAMIVTVALPSIQHGLHFSGQTQLQWVINLYILLFGGFLLLGGRAGDLFGRQRVFIAGLVIFTGASLFNGLSQSPAMLLAGRAVQGFGGALIVPAVLSIIINTFSDEGERTKALGVFAAVSAASGAAGLALGGVLTQELSWRWIFLVNVPVGVIAALLATRFVPDSRAPGDHRPSLDIAGAVTVTGGLTLLIYAIVNAQKWGWGSHRFVGWAATAVLLLAVFVAVELRSRAPLVRLGIFKIRSLRAANATMFLMVAGLFVVMFFPTLYMQEVLGYSPIKTGLAYLPWPAMMILASGVAQQLLRRFDPRPILVVGLMLNAAGLFSFHSLPVGGSYASDVLPGLLLTAAGAGLAWATLFLQATNGVPGEEAGLASGLINSSQQLGSAIGLAVAATVAAAYTAHLLHRLHAAATASQHAAALGQGFHRGFLVAGGVAAAAAFVGAIATPKPKSRPGKADLPLIEAKPAAASGDGR